MDRLGQVKPRQMAFALRLIPLVVNLNDRGIPQVRRPNAISAVLQWSPRVQIRRLKLYQAGRRRRLRGKQTELNNPLRISSAVGLSDHIADINVRQGN